MGQILIRKKSVGKYNRGLSRHDMQLLNHVRNESDSYGADHADAPIAVNPGATRLGGSAGNPSFVAQFDVSVVLAWFTVAAGVYTATTYAAVAAAVPATAAAKLPAFVFGNSDFAGGFAKLRAQFPLTTWTYDNPLIYGVGREGTSFGDLDAVAKAALSPGDLVIPVTLISGGINYVTFVIVRCTQVAYGTLLDALNSDMFMMNMIRFIVPDATAASLNQYQNNISILKQSLFGKFDSDFVSPNSFKLPEQQQDNIIDIPLKKGIDKQVALALMVNPNIPNGTFQWSIFVNFVDKTAF
jgi:hypothetical protein